VRDLLDSLDCHDLDVDSRVSSLSVGQRQRVEIAKALGQKARILIMDEPTASLSEKDVMRLMDVGGSIDQLFPKMEAELDSPVLEVENLCYGPLVRNISFTLRRGQARHHPLAPSGAGSGHCLCAGRPGAARPGEIHGVA
jgi:ABC-type sugar transport system ATPase subunit